MKSKLDLLTFALGALATLGITFGGVFLYQNGLIPGFAQPIVVAIVDSGLDLEVLEKEFPGAKQRLSVNPGEIPNNGLDDDKNGKVDDVFGWDFLSGESLKKDEAGHGTRLAREILENCGRCQILPLRVTSKGQAIDPRRVVEAIQYGMARRARVVNLSLGLSRRNASLDQLLTLGTQEKVIFIAAAGHGVANPFEGSSLRKIFPQSHEGAIVVGSDPVHPAGNRGREIDLSVKTKGAESSVAAAHVSGVVARYLQNFTKSDVYSVRHRLRATSTALSSYQPMQLGYGVLNAKYFQARQVGFAHYRIYSSKDSSKRVAEFSVQWPMTQFSVKWDCSEGMEAPQMSYEKFLKGRATVTVEGAVPDECSALVVEFSFVQSKGKRRAYRVDAKHFRI